MATKSPRGALGADDLAGLKPEQRRKLLERNPQLREALEGPAPSPPPAPAPAPDPAPPAPPRAGEGERGPTGPAGEAAPKGRAVRRSPRKRPGTSRRPSSPSGRRLASRVARETPGVPGPSATNLVLAFLGTTVLVVGLVLVLSPQSSRGLARLSPWLGAATQKLLDPDDPIF